MKNVTFAGNEDIRKETVNSKIKRMIKEKIDPDHALQFPVQGRDHFQRKIEKVQIGIKTY